MNKHASIINKAGRLALAVGLAMACTVTATAAARDTVQGHKVSLQVVGQREGALDVYPWGGQWWVAGENGQRYSLRLRNRSNSRVLAVVAVDGVNAVTGQTASVSQPGYVLMPGQVVVIEGWRKNMNEVARFYFTPVSNSYAGKTGRGHQAGVIGVAVFDEKAPPVHISSNSDAAMEKSAAGPSASATAAPASARMGTGHGERVDSPVSSTQFERRSKSPYEIVSLRYDSRANLIQRGVIKAERYPEAFPGGFVPDPEY